MPKTKKKNTKTKPVAGPGRVNKSKWIREQPPTMPAKEIVAKAKSQGIKLSIAQVYTARSAAKKKSGRIGKPGRPKGARAVAVPAGGTISNRSIEELRHEYVRIAMRIGTDEAQRLLDRIIDVQTPGR